MAQPVLLLLLILCVCSLDSIQAFKMSSFRVTNVQASGSPNLRRMHAQVQKESVLNPPMTPLRSRVAAFAEKRDRDVAEIEKPLTGSRPAYMNLLIKSGMPLALAGAVLFGMNSPAFAGGLESASESFKAMSAGNDGGFLQSFLLIFISEIGDKTFFIAGLLAAKYGRLISFTGSIGALAVMTVLSTVLGQIFHAIPPSLTQGVPYDDVIAVAAFAYFGLKTLYDSSKLGDGDNSGIEEEKADAEEVVEGMTQEQKRDSLIARITQTFGLVFAAEIGDRSFLSTIALSAALNPYAVASGAILAHASATGVAVAGGVILSRYLSEKVIGYISAALFLIFAVTTAVGIF